MPTKYFTVQNCATYCHYAGATTLPDVIPDFSRGRKIIFAHAAGSNGHSWHHQLDHLGAAHSPIALCFPGHGRSAGVEGLASVRDYSDFLAAFADTLKIKSAVIAGRSMGRAPQAFVTDGYSPKTISGNFDAIRAGWMEQIKTDPRVRYTDLKACAEVELRWP